MNKKRNMSWNEYLFKNRHKEYGAYDLRMREGRNLLQSLLIVLFLVGTLTITLSFTHKENVVEDPGPPITEYKPEIVEFDKKEKEKPKDEIEKVAPKPKPKVDHKLDADIMPTPTDAPDIETPINRNDDIGMTEADDDDEGSGDPGIKYSDTDGTDGGTDITPAPIPTPPTKEVDNTIYNVREITKMAIFPGCEKAGSDKKALQNCMAKKLRSELGVQLSDFQDIADKYRIDKAATKLFFVVDKNGKIIEIRATDGGDKLFGTEAQKALKNIADRMAKKGNYIKPAEMEDGTKVNMHFSIPLHYVTQ